MKKYEVTQNWINDLLNIASEKDLDVTVFESTLVDKYLVYANKEVKIPGIRRTRFIIIDEEYQNTWNSINVATFTDDYKKAVNFIADNDNSGLLEPEEEI